MQIALGIMGILTMFVFCFISIWGFILFHQMVNQLKYRNYLMEKLIESISNKNETEALYKDEDIITGVIDANKNDIKF